MLTHINKKKLMHSPIRKKGHTEQSSSFMQGVRSMKKE